MLATAVASLTANAQVKLNDKNANAYDLGYGVEISNFLSTASATTITGEELQQTSATNLAQALYGRLPGLTALSQGGFSGDENKGATFNIRGFHTLNDTGILILVDGYERPIDRLSVEEVESVTVLKDAAATALLGHEGINGAILVKTKRGAEGKTRWATAISSSSTLNSQTWWTVTDMPALSIVPVAMTDSLPHTPSRSLTSSRTVPIRTSILT